MEAVVSQSAESSSAAARLSPSTLKAAGAKTMAEPHRLLREARRPWASGASRGFGFSRLEDACLDIHNLEFRQLTALLQQAWRDALSCNAERILVIVHALLTPSEPRLQPVLLAALVVQRDDCSLTRLLRANRQAPEYVLSQSRRQNQPGEIGARLREGL